MNPNYARNEELAKRQWGTLEDLFGKTEDPILVFGPPGTGKSAFPVLHGRATGKAVDVFNVNKFSSKPDLLGHFINTKDGSVFCFNAGARAMSNGNCLVLNEIDHGGPEIMSTFHFICDHQTIAQETLPDGKGTVLRAKKGYRVYATMNGEPVNLPLAIRDRFQLKVNITMPNPAAVQTLPEDLRSIAYADGVTLRNLVAVDNLRKANIGNLKRCLEIVLGNKSSELSEAIALAAA